MSSMTILHPDPTAETAVLRKRMRNSANSSPDVPLVIEGPEQSRVNPELPDAGLPPAVGVQSFQVFRASRAVPELCDAKGWTYHHHVDMACWKGRLYVGWNSCEKDEDIWPSRELYSTSLDGARWSPPAELFPQGVSTCLRMYFFRARNDRMLVIAGLRSGPDKTNEEAKGGLVVREIRADHTLGDIFTLQSPPVIEKRPPMFESSKDAGFVEACRHLLADRIFLEQQDYGRLLGPRRMKWHDPANWPGGTMPGKGKWVFGKAMSFYRRGSEIFAANKMGWVVTSKDDGETWSTPVIPPTLVTGGAKVWAQQTADGRYALVYNPARKNRFPLAIVTSDDGVHFRDMRIVQGELPVQRYSGRDRSIGPQYVRGISTWADDGSRQDQAIWLVYSMSKEDIWASRVPLPVKTSETGGVNEDFSTAAEGPFVPGWNTYCPKWAKVEIARRTGGGGKCLRLENRDPHDYARAIRVFRESARASVSFKVRANEQNRQALEIELLGTFGSPRPVQLRLGNGIFEGITPAGSKQRSFSAGQWVSVTIEVDAANGTFSVALNDEQVLHDVNIAEPADTLNRISFRTGGFRGIGGACPIAPESDRPTDPSAYEIADLRVEI